MVDAQTPAKANRHWRNCATLKLPTADIFYMDKRWIATRRWSVCKRASV